MDKGLSYKKSTKFILNLSFYEDITIENFREKGVPLTKCAIPFLDEIYEDENNTNEMDNLYNKVEITTRKYLEKDIIDWNQYLWVNKEIATKVKKLLKNSESSINPYCVVVPLLFYQNLKFFLDVSAKDFVPGHSVIEFLKTIEDLDDKNIRKRTFNLKSHNLKTYDQFDSETLIFIKQAVNYYIKSAIGEKYIAKIQLEHQNLNMVINFINTLQGRNKRSTHRWLKNWIVYSLDQLLRNHFRNVRKRFYIIGELLTIFVGVSKQQEKCLNKEDFYYNNLRRCARISN
ncbi:MAG: hypothetical protein IPP86_07085 [Bacteroidetes bacterium]|nr:hypothetical protein [Bacteroidota bacterium]